MMTINFNPFPVLETERLILRKPEVRDIDEMYHYRSNPELMRYIPHRLAHSKEQVANAMNFIHGLIDKNEGINWAITKKGDDKIIGMVGYVRFFLDHYRAEIGYMLHTPHHGTGIAQEATQAAINYGFDVMGLHSIEAIINYENEASKRLVEKMGFTKDAFFKDYLHHAGKFMSANVYSLVRE
jgi:ribosomal-protein-alanine N-acetyltransferase